MTTCVNRGALGRLSDKQFRDSSGSVGFPTDYDRPVSSILHALWLLCLLGSVVFAAVAAPRGRWLALMATGCLVTTTLSLLGIAPDPELAGGLAAGSVIVYLFSPRHAWVAVLLGGALAGMSVGVVVTAGARPALGAGLLALILGWTVVLARRRPAFAPDAVREEALLIVGLLGIVVAVTPGVLNGWQAATNLNVQVEQATMTAIPLWSVSVVAASVVLGAAHAMWSRR